MLLWCIISLFLTVPNVRICFGQDAAVTTTEVATTGETASEDAATTQGEVSVTTAMQDGGDTETKGVITEAVIAATDAPATEPPRNTEFDYFWKNDTKISLPPYPPQMNVIPVDQTKDVKFDMSWYTDGRTKSVVRIWGKQLPAGVPTNCYGVLINWLTVLTPCSCVSYSKDKADVKTAWNHPKNAKKTIPISSSNFEVSLMMHEHDSNVDSLKVKVTNVKLHPSCDNLFTTDFAVLTLKEKLKDSRLAWVSTAEKRDFNEELQSLSIAEILIGRCEVSYYSSMKDKTSELQNATVHFQHWSECSALVCPPTLKGEPTIGWRNTKICNNSIDAHKFCMAWVQRPSFCNLPPGTPVFCSARARLGLVGLLNNNSVSCAKYSFQYNILDGFSDALPWVENYLNIIYAPGYSDLLSPERRSQLYSKATMLTSNYGSLTVWIIASASGKLVLDFLIPRIFFS